MSLTRFKSQWGDVSFRGFCRPEDFASALIDDFNRAIARSINFSESTDSFATSFTEAGLKRIIEMFYCASLIMEEGRILRFRAVIGPKEAIQVPFEVTCLFEPPIPIDDFDSIRRLVPSISSDLCGLWLNDDGTEILCLGVVHMIQEKIVAGIPDFLPRSTKGIRSNFACCDLRVLGPGEMSGSIGLADDILFRAGTLRRCTPSYMAMDELLEQCENAIRLKHSRPSPWPDARVDLKGMLSAMWASILNAAITGHHGGTFIVLPDDVIHQHRSLKKRYPIDGGFGTELDLGWLAVQFLYSCFVTAPDLASKEPLNDAGLWSAFKEELNVGIRAASALSQVDGCVVLDRSLRVIRFGAKLGGESKMPLVDYYDHTVDLEAEMKRLGTRNNSACRFCRNIPGTVALVVSQDGELRMYRSEEAMAFAFEGLDVHL